MKSLNYAIFLNIYFLEEEEERKKKRRKGKRKKTDGPPLPALRAGAPSGRPVGFFPLSFPSLLLSFSFFLKKIYTKKKGV